MSMRKSASVPPSNISGELRNWSFKENSQGLSYYTGEMFGSKTVKDGYRLIIHSVLIKEIREYPDYLIMALKTNRMYLLWRDTEAT